MVYPTLFLDFLKELEPIEGGYSNNPNDAGGETNHGITVAVARRHGYTGSMRALPYSFAQKVYYTDYWEKLNLNRIGEMSKDIAIKMADIGVNCGTYRSALWLQRSLNVLNNPNSRGVKPWPDLILDADVGPKTTKALETYLNIRKSEGELVLFRMLNCLQGAHYIQIAEPNTRNEAFVYGWFRTRIS